MEENISIWSASIPEWLSAIGTIGAVVVALFWNSLKHWIDRPKIVISCGKSNPYIELLDDNTQSQSDTKEIRLRIKITNDGKDIAKNCLLIIDSYYSQRKDGTYIIKEFTPKQMKDYRNANIYFVAPHLNYYFDIINIHKIDKLIDANDTGHQKQFYKPSILGDGKTINLSRGTYIIPLKFYSSKVKTSITYIKLFWDSDTCEMNDSTFDYSIISNKEFEKLKKGKL